MWVAYIKIFFYSFSNGWMRHCRNSNCLRKGTNRSYLFVRGLAVVWPVGSGSECRYS